jgi:hypothetical protein
MANAAEYLVGRSGGHEWAVFMATSGHFCWPPAGTNYWPLTCIVPAAAEATWKRHMNDRPRDGGGSVTDVTVNFVWGVNGSLKRRFVGPVCGSFTGLLSKGPVTSNPTVPLR